MGDEGGIEAPYIESARQESKNDVKFSEECLK